MRVLDQAEGRRAEPQGTVGSRFSHEVVPEIQALLRFALSLTGQQADAEDLVQETLMRAYRSMDRFDGEHPRAWLFTIMRRARIDGLRRKRPLVVADIDEPGTATAKAVLVDSAEDQVLAGTFDAVVEAAYGGLSPVDQEVLQVVDIGGLSYAEAASLLGVTVDAMTSRLHRARARLRGRLDEAGLAPKPHFAWEEGSS